MFANPMASQWPYSTQSPLSNRYPFGAHSGTGSSSVGSTNSTRTAATTSDAAAAQRFPRVGDVSTKFYHFCCLKNYIAFVHVFALMMILNTGLNVLFATKVCFQMIQFQQLYPVQCQYAKTELLGHYFDLRLFKYKLNGSILPKVYLALIKCL